MVNTLSLITSNIGYVIPVYFDWYRTCNPEPVYTEKSVIRIGLTYLSE